MCSRSARLFAVVTVVLLACVHSSARAENAAPVAFGQPVPGVRLFGKACPELRQYVDAAARIESAFDGVFVGVGMAGGARVGESRLGVSRTEALVARDEVLRLSMLDSAMLSAGALGVVAQLAWNVVTGDAAGGTSRTNGHTELIIVPGGLVARGRF